MNIKDDQPSMYVTAEGFGKKAMPTNQSQLPKTDKENGKISPRNITVLNNDDLKKSVSTLPIGPQNSIGQD